MGISNTQAVVFSQTVMELTGSIMNVGTGLRDTNSTTIAVVGRGLGQ